MWRFLVEGAALRVGSSARMTTPWERYQLDLQREDFAHDPAQEHAVQLLQDLYERLVARAAERSGGMARWLRQLRGEREEPETGLYFWGGVGRGKTYLVDCFFDCLPFSRKLRVHFNRFMQRVHENLTELEGEKNPLEKVAEQLADETMVICFDEFYVSDIADAMILGGLMEALFARGVTLVATSNIEPQALYENGLQRQRFLPAIALVEKYTNVVNIDAGVDYRLRTLEQARLYYYPLDARADDNLRASFQKLAAKSGLSREPIEVNNRLINCRCRSGDVVWFSFKELCDGPRSQNDYIELSRLFRTVLVSGVPVFKANSDDLARRFVNLVDEFYDRNVKLIITAEAALPVLYAGGQLEFEFQRTISRLQEMQSVEYLARQHKP